MKLVNKTLSSSPNILVIGTGAIGGFYGGKLAEAGQVLLEFEEEFKNLKEFVVNQ